MKTPMGEAVDRAVLSKGSLLLRKRTITQGPLTIEYESKDGKVSGTMTMNGQSKPIAADTGVDLFGEGPGLLDAIARLPLADGYTAAFRNFDPQMQQTKTVEIKVVGSESISVPAGTFDTFKVQTTNAAGSSAVEWVAKSTRHVVKAVVNTPTGATVTMELQR
jgi:hypothetical protein